MSNTTTETPTLSSQITGNDYFSCYRSRMEVNDGYFRNVARQLTEMGCKVYVPTTDAFISFIKVVKEDKHIFFGFNYVPYRWYMDYNINYKLGQGSGRQLCVEHDYNKPYTATQIIDSLKPNVPTIGGDSHLILFTI